MNIKEKVEEVRKSKTYRTTVIPHTKPIQADSAAIPEYSLRKNDFLCYKEHSEILFAFSSVLVKVMQPSAVRTIRLIPFSTCLSNLQNITSEVRIFFVLFVISLYFSLNFFVIFCINFFHIFLSSSKKIYFFSSIFWTSSFLFISHFFHLSSSLSIILFYFSIFFIKCDL